MTSRPRLYTRFRFSSTNQNESEAEAVNLIILDINMNGLLISDERIKTKVFLEENVDSWFDYITSGITNIYLFTSNIFSNIVLQSICEYPQIQHVYLFCKDDQYQNYSDLHGKLRGIFNKSSEMLKQFRENIAQPQAKFYSEQSTFQNIDEESSETLWWNFFDKALQCITNTCAIMNEFVSFCNAAYQGHQVMLRMIDEFRETYEAENVIGWYTREFFFYRLLNQTLRTPRNLNDIFKFRFVINDLRSALKQIQRSSFESADSFITYRGQLMSTEEVKRLQSNIGKLISMNQFLSTSLDISVAEIFAASRYANLESILMIIRVDSSDIKNASVPFANIAKHTVWETEEEVLFSMHSTFLVESVEFEGEKKRWVVHLKYVDNTWNVDFGERCIFSPHADQIYIRHLSNENKQFIAYQLLLDMVLRLDPNEYAKQELLEFCRSKYQGNPVELRKIGQFEQNYCPKDAAQWYTKDSFLYRLLNQSLRVEIIDSIVKLRYFIHHLHNQLAERQALDGEKESTLYRGQTMTVNQLVEIGENDGGLISFNSFTSTTDDQSVAISFLGDIATIPPHEVPVIYEMSVNTGIRSTPFAKIDSINPDEREILFSMGAVFRIGKIEEVANHPGVYCVKLKLEHIEDELWNKLTKHLD